MSFYEQLCQLNDEDLPDKEWLESVLDDIKPNREEVSDFVSKLDGEIKERNQKLIDLENELEKQKRRLKFAIDCKGKNIFNI